MKYSIKKDSSCNNMYYVYIHCQLLSDSRKVVNYHRSTDPKTCPSVVNDIFNEILAIHAIKLESTILTILFNPTFDWHVDIELKLLEILRINFDSQSYKLENVDNLSLSTWSNIAIESENIISKASPNNYKQRHFLSRSINKIDIYK